MAHGALVAGCRSVHGCDVGDSAMGCGKSLGGGWDVGEMIELHRVHCPHCSTELWIRINGLTVLEAARNTDINFPLCHKSGLLLDFRVWEVRKR